MHAGLDHRSAPPVSVVVPLFNKGRYVARAIESILGQTFSDFEIAVVDDGSTDDGPDIVRSIGDPRIRLIHQENAGPGGARNRAIKESGSPLLAFLDADDEWLPDYLNKTIGLLRNHTDCDLVISGRYWGPERMNREAVVRRDGITEGPWRLEPDADIYSMKKALDFFWSPAIVCSRHVIERYGGFYDKYRCTLGEDRYLWLQVMLNHRVYRNPEPLVWWHTEASELAIGRKTDYPILPALTDPSPIRESCPAEYLPLLERYLAWKALWIARSRARAGDDEGALGLIRNFPLGKTFIREYLKTLLSLCFWPLFRIYRALPGARRITWWLKNIVRFDSQ